MSREENFERMLQAVLDEYDVTVEKMAKLKKENKTKTVTYRQLMTSKLTLQNIISRYEVYGLIEKQKFRFVGEQIEQKIKICKEKI